MTGRRLSVTRYAKYIGHVGSLAVALGVGMAVSQAAVAAADTDRSPRSAESSAESSSGPESSTSPRDGDEAPSSEAADSTTNDSDTDGDAEDEDSVGDIDTDEADPGDDDEFASETVDAETASGGDELIESADSEIEESVPASDTTEAGIGTDPESVGVAADEDEAPTGDSAGTTLDPATPVDPVALAATVAGATREVETAPTASADATVGDEDDDIVTGLYREMLRRDPSDSELAFDTTLLNIGGTGWVVNRLYNSREFRQGQVQSYYNELLGRDPSAPELAWKTFLLRVGLPEPLVVTSIMRTTEYYEDSGDTATDFVYNMYRSVLGDNVDESVLPTYVQQLQGGAPRLWVALQFVTSGEYREVKVQEAYWVVLGRAGTEEEVAAYVDSWWRYGGQSGITRNLLNSAENITRMTTSEVPLPDMVAVDQLAQILMAAYNEEETGFVDLLSTLLATSSSGEVCVDEPCNTALYDLIAYGGTDRGIPNAAIEVTAMTPNVGSLTSSQNEISVSSAISYPLQNSDFLEVVLDGGLINPGSPIVTSDFGTYIVDGHTRWAEVYIFNPYTEIASYDLGYVPDAQEALKETQLAIAALEGYLPSKSASEPNVFTVDEDTFDALVEELIEDGDDPDSIYEVFSDVAGLDSLEEIQDYLWANVSRLQENNPYISGATARDYMPQSPDYIQTMFHLMENGSLSFSFPIIAYLG